MQGLSAAAAAETSHLFRLIGIIAVDEVTAVEK